VLHVSLSAFFGFAQVSVFLTMVLSQDDSGAKFLSPSDTTVVILCSAAQPSGDSGVNKPVLPLVQTFSTYVYVQYIVLGNK
jgi:hypothetical protein